MRFHKKNVNWGINIGTTSLLLVFVILCLVSFSVLSIVSSNANKKLNDKISEKSHSYYDACTQANVKLLYLDHELESIYKDASDASQYFDKAGKRSEFYIEVSSLQSLHITCDILYPENIGDPYYQITSWQLENVSEDTGDTRLNLLDFNN